MRLVDKLEMLSSGGKAVVEVQRLAKLSTLDVICETSMGVSVDALHSDSDYVEAVDQITKFLFKRFANPLTLFSNLIYAMTSDGRTYYKYLRTIHEFTWKVILENIAQREQKGKKREEDQKEEAGDGGGDGRYNKKKVLIDVLLDMYERDEIDMDGVQEEVDTFMFAGNISHSCFVLMVVS